MSPHCLFSRGLSKLFSIPIYHPLPLIEATEIAPFEMRQIQFASEEPFDVVLRHHLW